MTQTELQTTILDGLLLLDARLRALPAHPPATAPDRWSHPQILSHIAILNEAYLARLRPLATKSGPPKDDRWRPTLLAGFLTKALANPRPMASPRAARPGPEPRPDPLAAVLATHAELRDLVLRAASLSWRHLHLVSPYAWFLRPNFGDAALILLRHGERHARQMELR
jgi:hypothetical protein